MPGREAREDDRVVDTPTYHGPERRNITAAELIAANWKLVTVMLSIVAFIFTAGVSYQSARMAMAGKVDKKEFAEVNTRQDEQINAVAKRTERLETVVIEQITPALRRLDSLSVLTNERIRDIYCVGKPPGCK